jgi:hypothetical protein
MMMSVLGLANRLWGFLYAYDDAAGIQAWVARNPNSNSSLAMIFIRQC